MRYVTASVLSALMLLTGCKQSQPSTAKKPATQQPNPGTETRRPRESYDEFDKARYTPLKSEVAINDEYSIAAAFPKRHPVCRADSGGHIHGFYQWPDGDCSDGLWGKRSVRFVSIWADYNAMEYSWTGAPKEYCGKDTVPFDLGVATLGDGRLSACKTKASDPVQEITAIYLADDPDRDLFKPENGPELIYSIRLGSTPKTKEVDLKAFRDFFVRLQLAGSGFRLAK